MRGQLSLEFVILMLLAILGGAIVTTQLVQPAKDLNLSSEPAKKDIIGVFLGPGSLTSNSGTGQENGSIINEQQENNNSDNTNNETNQNSTEQNNGEQEDNITKLPDLTVSISAYYENGSLCCHGKHRVRNRGENQQLQNRFRHGKIKVGDKIIIKIKVSNIGSADVNKTFWVRIYEGTSNRTIATFPINGSKVNETVAFNFTVNVTKDGLKCGKCYCHRYRYRYGYGDGYRNCYGNGCSISMLGNEYSIIAYVDYNNIVKESNESNNIDYVILKYVNTTNNNDSNDDNNSEIIPGNSSYLSISVGKYSFISLKKDIIPNGTYKSGNINIVVNKNNIGKYNANGTIWGDIKTDDGDKNNKAELYFGNLYYIKNVYFSYIHPYSHTEFIGNIIHNVSINNNIDNNAEVLFDSTNIDELKISNLNSENSKVDIINSEVKNIQIECIDSTAKLLINNSNIGNINIKNINNQNSELIISKSNVYNCININNLDSKITIKDGSTIDTLIINESIKGKLILSNNSKIKCLEIYGNLDGKVIINRSLITLLYIKGNVNSNARIEIIDNSNIYNLIINKYDGGAKIIIEDNSDVNITNSVAEKIINSSNP
ncbi:Protein of unknown function DUF361 [Methanocaldococcus infernus ME]|uniref:Uncharacterized protein n=1 Tax=Methanocaldococcus infernus (strain DSM 11812 / JCM 15783 / ME) TaxID=573063 RepID=D5VSA4_METIM|nr:CARDB domain-containing protein [Methanocaldococcus infernus]ADG13457.1 Protein of unknown function DUF361 [Methanocaldococcus infernus ME]